jgi:hypothetical protein
MQQLVEALGKTEPTYADIGATRDGRDQRAFATTGSRSSSAADTRRSAEPSAVSRPERHTGFPA